MTSKMSLQEAQAHTKALVDEWHKNAPYLDSPASVKTIHDIFSGPSRIHASIADGTVSKQNIKQMRQAVAEAQRLAEYTLKRTVDREEVRASIGIERLTWADNDDIMIVCNPEVRERYIKAVTEKEIDAEVAHLKEQAAWYGEGAEISKELLAAVEAQLQAQSPLVSAGENAKDRLETIRRKVGI